MAIFARDQPDAAVEAILLASRPEPDPIWVEGLERRLLTRPRLVRSRLRVARLSFALAGGLAAVALTLSLAGVGPLVRRSDSVDARDDCRVVTVPQTERVPVLVRDFERRSEAHLSRPDGDAARDPLLAVRSASRRSRPRAREMTWCTLAALNPSTAPMSAALRSAP